VTSGHVVEVVVLPGPPVGVEVVGRGGAEVVVVDGLEVEEVVVDDDFVEEGVVEEGVVEEGVEGGGALPPCAMAGLRTAVTVAVARRARTLPATCRRSRTGFIPIS
jgi:hypothetical protein